MYAVNNLDRKVGYSIDQSMASILSATRCQQLTHRGIDRPSWSVYPQNAGGKMVAGGLRR